MSIRIQMPKARSAASVATGSSVITPETDPHRSAVTALAAGLSPAYFAMVMATGIVSLSTHMLGLVWLASALFFLNIAAYAIIWTLYLLRIRWFGAMVLGDLTDHQRAPGFFTAVAASGTLGAQCVLIAGSYHAAVALWVLAVILWVTLIYTVLTALTIKEDKPALSDGISGAWLLAVVATQSVASLSALVSLHWNQPYRLMINYFALSMWLWGGMLYIWMISLIFYRYTFFRFSPADLSPPYWINMGAMAISTLAGAASLMGIAKVSRGSPPCNPPAFPEALRVLRLVVPEHSGAEEELAFPRLGRALPSGSHDTRRLMDTLEEEHGCADRAHEEADRLGKSWLAKGALSTAQTSRLIAVLEGLADLYSRHVRLEETEIFPLPKKCLPPEDLASLQTELVHQRLTVGGDIP